MPRYLVPAKSRKSYGIGLCDRCRRKFFLDQLQPDPNSPGMRVCKEDLDQFDPYRLPGHPAEDIGLKHPRPDVQLYGDQFGILTSNYLFMGGEDSYITEQANMDTMVPVNALGVPQQQSTHKPTDAYQDGPQINALVGRRIRQES
jgi:hypothetical protein